MNRKIQHFLLVFDHEDGRLIDTVDSVPTAKRPWLPTRPRRRSLRTAKLVEIVLIGSDSIETVMLTHANYFDGSAALSGYLAGH